MFSLNRYDETQKELKLLAVSKPLNWLEIWLNFNPWLNKLKNKPNQYITDINNFVFQNMGSFTSHYNISSSDGKGFSLETSNSAYIFLGIERSYVFVLLLTTLPTLATLV